MSDKDIEYWKQKPLEDILQQWNDCIENGEILLNRIDKAINKLYSIPIEPIPYNKLIEYCRDTLHILKGEDNE